MGKNIVIKKTKQIIKKDEKYIFPSEKPYDPNVELYFSNPPNSKNWIHGIQIDDTLNDDTERRTKQFHALKKIISPEQRTKGWYEQRDSMITASLIPTALGMNEYEKQYHAIINKLIDIPFTGKKACFWGKKYESVATAIYQYRMNVIVDLFGCIPHDCKFIGASPDGIVSEFKLDGIHKTNLVGRMLEIKCVVSRKINMVSNDIHEVIPEHYFPQPQIQMQCCKLDDCDFWQCNIKEYKSRDEFIDDTNPHEPFRSKSAGFEKGVIIQLLPISDIKGRTDRDLEEIRYDHAKWIYPKTVEMTPHDCDLWVAQTCSTCLSSDEWENYMIDKIVYWKLYESRCITMKRDDKWFKEHYMTIEKIWNYIKFFRSNEKSKKVLLDYVKFAEETFNDTIINEKIMKVADDIFHVSGKIDSPQIKSILSEISQKRSNESNSTNIDNSRKYTKYHSNQTIDFNQVLLDD
jgi:putative phage-type endonuclease